MTPIMKRINEYYFVEYDLNDMNPIYFDNIYELLLTTNLPLKKIVYKMNNSLNDYFFISNNTIRKIYFFHNK